MITIIPPDNAYSQNTPLPLQLTPPGSIPGRPSNDQVTFFNPQPPSIHIREEIERPSKMMMQFRKTLSLAFNFVEIAMKTSRNLDLVFEQKNRRLTASKKVCRARCFSPVPLLKVSNDPKVQSQTSYISVHISAEPEIRWRKFELAMIIRLSDEPDT
ncbi:hypothetical protein CEXT_642731 [Caerostris extrusa]|uniref:Uncharacterized protein n=1 Tax=Caerostris extrusa TaxID=172846 RepID=A0AAV4RBU3_CAEEX|nr:hypothetical protein CEXT_642731 [Caerostris extrusa]